MNKFTNKMEQFSIEKEFPKIRSWQYKILDAKIARDNYIVNTEKNFVLMSIM